ncbi:hypothetical protein HPULCUR_008815 [Helicostylum pulchrum]|uniref:ubiquitinyl hydrolase 1 n=1 Tax=Helicostylum pulchrum TaxID=562976 RepID=A0ABP9Y8P4_9FUNG
MPSGKILMPTLCFGEISRDEINTVLNIAGVSLSPPKKTPFATGIQYRKPVVIHSPPPKQQFETVFVEPEEDETPIVEEKPIVKPVEEEKAIEEKPVVEEKPTRPEPQQQQKSKPTQPAPPPPPPTTTSKPEPHPQPQQLKQQKQSKQQKNTIKKEATKQVNNAKASTTPPVEVPSPQPEPTTATTTAATAATAPAAPAAAPVPAPITSWASVLKKSEPVKKAAAATVAATPATNGKPLAKSAKPSSPTSSSTKFTGVADIINKYEPNYNAPLLQPRGLINNVNTCFMNVILQPLSHCAPFYNLIKTISKQTKHAFKSKTPLLDSIVEFIDEFQFERLDNLEPYGEPFVPEYVYNALRGQKKFDTLRGRQEDSEEFLCYLLDGLHEEMTAVLKEQSDKKEAEAAAANGGEGWLEVGAKNKTSNLRSTGFEESPISRIFCGKLRSVLQCPGAKDSINQEPYQSLPLDIQPENVHSIEDAIGNMTVAETMQDYTSPEGRKVDATKKVYLEGLPPVLILHMKRFVFDNIGGVQKLSKQVNYGSKLVINPEWMVPSLRPSEPITYELFGSVYHHGTSAGGGHYTCDIKRKTGEWLHIDDTTITSVSEQDVLVTDENTRTSEKLHAGQTAYILFYVRSS